MAHVLPYHSHNVSPVKVETKESTVGRYLDAYFPLALTKSLAKASSFVQKLWSFNAVIL